VAVVIAPLLAPQEKPVWDPFATQISEKHSQCASPWHAARNNSPAQMCSAEVRELCSQLPLAIVGAAHSPPTCSRNRTPVTGLPSPAGNSVPPRVGENIMAYKSKLFLAREHFPARFHSRAIGGGCSMTAFDPRRSQRADLTNMTV